MNLKEALIHRIRDFDACLHLERKPKLFAYVLLRQFSKFLGFDESRYSYLIEKNSAKFADVLTTISSITALEVENFLKRKVDYILPNGIDLGKFPTFEEIVASHRRNRNIILNFILFFFSPYFQKSCPTRNSLIFFLSGRKEIRNKGFDLAILALGKLNQILKEKNINRNIYVFVFVPDEVIDINHQILENLITYRGLENYLQEIKN